MDLIFSCCLLLGEEGKTPVGKACFQDKLVGVDVKLVLVAWQLHANLRSKPQRIYTAASFQSVAIQLAFWTFLLGTAGGNPFQMNPNDMMAAGGAIAEMMEMARKWQASNPGAPQGGGSSNNPFPPMQLPLPVDLEEGEASYTLTADVPGLQKSDLKVNLPLPPPSPSPQLLPYTPVRT